MLLPCDGAAVDLAQKWHTRHLPSLDSMEADVAGRTCIVTGPTRFDSSCEIAFKELMLLCAPTVCDFPLFRSAMSICSNAMARHAFAAPRQS